MKNKNIYLRYIPMSIIAALIIFFAVKNAINTADGQQAEIWYLIFKTTPTLITLFVQLLMIAANRYAFLLGGINCIFYGVVYFIEGIPFSAISALFFSLPLQAYSFFNWKNNAKSGQVSLRCLGTYGRIITLVVSVGMWAICYFWLSRYMVMKIPMFDTLIFALGITCTVLSAIRYIESQYLGFISNAATLVMWIILTIRNPSNISYVIISVYNVYCVGQAVVNWTLLYYKDTKNRTSKIKDI